MKQIHPSIGKMSDATFLLFVFRVAQQDGFASLLP
jgi:hypothetical protein